MNIARGGVEVRQESTETIQTTSPTSLPMEIGMKHTNRLQTNLTSLLMEIGTKHIRGLQMMNLTSLPMETGMRPMNNLQVKDPISFLIVIWIKLTHGLQKRNTKG